MTDAGPAAPPARVFPNLRQALLLLLLFLLTTALAMAAFRPLRHEVSEQLWFFLVVLVGEGLGVLCGLRLARWPLRRVFGHLGFSTRTLRWLILIGIGNLLFIGSLLYALAQIFGPLEQGDLVRLFSVRNSGEFLLLFLTIAVAAPLLEEILVRGILLRGLTFSWGATGGVLWSTLFFALIHMNPFQAGPAFVNGVVWALVLLRTGSLGSTLFLHSLNNGLVFVLVQMALLAPETEGSAALVAPSGLRAAMVALVGLAGLTLVLTALGALPRAPGRLAAFWGLPQAILRISPAPEAGRPPAGGLTPRDLPLPAPFEQRSGGSPPDHA